MNRVHIRTYGCQMNERDSQAVAHLLRQRGYSIVEAEQDADIVLLNTCSVRDQAEQKAIGKAGYLAKRKRQDPRLLIGIMGCMAQNRGADLLDRLPDLDLLVGTQKFHQVPDHLDNLISAWQAQGPRPHTVVDLEEEAGSQNTIRYHDETTRQVTAFVSIMQGCNMQCAFCIVPKTRGAERCRPMEDILEEVEELVSRGTREVTLLGQIVTSYGRREIPFRNGKSPFVQLLEKLQEVRGLERIRFTSPHPRGFKQDLVEAYRDLSKLCEYVHLPVQSGSNDMLRRMNRPYSRERYLEIVGSLRDTVPGMYFSTDVIVGFPGETMEDFRQTYSLFEEVRYDMAFVFKYSVRTGTPAESLGDPITAEEKESRNQELLRLVTRFSEERNFAMVGTIQEVLVEGISRKGASLTGRNRGNRVVHFPGDSSLVGRLVPVRIERATASALYGHVDFPVEDPSASAREPRFRPQVVSAL